MMDIDALASSQITESDFQRLPERRKRGIGLIYHDRPPQQLFQGLGTGMGFHFRAGD